MRSQSRSSLSTLVFMVPLLGVPLMAIFGVPQFVPVIASSVSEDVTRPSANRRSRGVGESAAATSLAAENASRGHAQIDDLFRPSKGSPRDSRPLRGEPIGREIKFVETSAGADTWLTQTSQSSRTRESSDRSLTTSATKQWDRSLTTSATKQSDRSVTTSATEQLVQGLTWREAVRRLNDLGIQEFRLEPGRQLGEFYFACEFTPDRDTRITRRFEAEAKEPLLAVAAVLRQIDEWLPRR